MSKIAAWWWIARHPIKAMAIRTFLREKEKSMHPLTMAAILAHRAAADALERGEHLGRTCCGLPLDEMGRCQNRPYHHTPTNPDLDLVAERVRLQEG